MEPGFVPLTVICGEAPVANVAFYFRPCSSHTTHTPENREQSSKETLDAPVRIKGTTLGFDERIRRRNYLSQLTGSSFDKKELNTMIAAEPLQHTRLTYLAKLRLARGSTEIPGMFTLVANESTNI